MRLRKNTSSLTCLFSAYLMVRGTSAAFAVETLPEVIVTGQDEKKESLYNPKKVSLQKYTEPLLNTPQSVTVVPKQILDDQGATTLRDSLRNVTGISIAAGEGGAQGDNLTIRGFSARSDLFLDGMRDFGSYYRDSFNYEQVEALKGPASLMFGRGSTGGIINQESKTPKLSLSAEGTLTFGTDWTKRATADINKPLTSIDEHSAFRLNVMAHENNISGRNIAENRRFGLAPTLAFGIGTSTRTTISYLHESENDIPDYGIPFLFGQPAPVDRKTYYGFQNTNFLKTDVDVFTTKIERDFDEHTSLRHQLRLAHYVRNIQVTEAQVPATVTSATPVDSIMVRLNQITAASTETSIDNDINLTFKFDTFEMKHKLVSGFEAIRETSTPVRTTFTGVPTANMTHPDQNQTFAGTGVVNSRVNAAITTLSPYLVDTLTLNKMWQIVGGVRWDWVNSSYIQNVGTRLNLTRIDSKASWRSGLIFKPETHGSIYFSYGTSFNPSAEQLSLSTATVNVAPEASETFELGSKWDLLSERLSLQGAIFRDQKTNARTPDPSNALLNVLSGDQRVDGFELGITGKPTQKWQIFTGYTYLSSKMVASTIAGVQGRPLANTPKHTGTLWATYQFNSKYQAGGGFKTISSRAASTTPDTSSGFIGQVPGYWTFDLMGKMQLTSDIDLQLNIINVTDTNYFDGVHSVHLIPGAGRTALLTTHFKL